MNKEPETNPNRGLSPAIQTVMLVVMVAALLMGGYFQISQDFNVLVDNQMQKTVLQAQTAATLAAQSGRQSLKEAQKLYPDASMVLLRPDRLPLDGGAAPGWVRDISGSTAPAASGTVARLVTTNGHTASLWNTLFGGAFYAESIAMIVADGTRPNGYLASRTDISPEGNAFRRGVWTRIGISLAVLLYCLFVALTCVPEMLARRATRKEMDSQTGLLNAAVFQERMIEELSRSGRYGRAVSIMIIEIDYLMTLIDGQGPVVADCILREISQLLKGSFRLVDIVAYRGEGQFLALLPETSLIGGLTAAERLRAKIEKHSFNAPIGAKLRLTASIGLSAAPPSLAELAPLMETAETALRAAKHAGRNQVSCFHDPVAA